MRCFVIILSMLIGVISISKSNPQNSETFSKTGEERLTLNGNWKFMIDPQQRGIVEKWFSPSHDFSKWDVMQVPGNWDTENEYAHYRGKAFYKRKIEIPENWIDGDDRVYLKFGAVYERATIWLNGNKIGSHIGGYTPFEFDVTQWIKVGATCTLVVMVDNSYGRGAWWPWGGISRSVSLVRNHKLRIVEQHIQAQPDLQTGKAKIQVKAYLKNHSEEILEGTMILTISKWISKGEIKPLSYSEIVQFSIEPETTEIITISVIMDSKDVALWHFDHPHLYQLNSRLMVDNALLHQNTERFGVRKIETQGSKLLLNGESIRLAGFNRVHDHRVWGNTEPIMLIQQDVDDMKSLGANLARLMHAPLAEDLLDYMDEKGFLVIEEIPIWGVADPLAFSENERPRQWLQEMVQRDFNHPCVIGWSVSNELASEEKDWKKKTMTTDQFNYVKDAMQFVRRTLDSLRLTTYVSMTAHRSNANPSNEPFDFADVVCINTYGNSLQVVKTVHGRWPTKPILVTEIGSGQIGLDPDTASLQNSLLETITALKKLEYVVGISIWTYNDYRSAYRNTPSSENRSWGVVNVWRQKKKAYYQIKDLFTPIRNLELELDEKQLKEGKAQGHLTITSRDEIDLPSYILKGYQIHCSILDQDQQKIANQIIDLPDIFPARTTHDESFSLDVNVIRAHNLLVELISPTGYSLHQTRITFKSPATPIIKEVISGNCKLRVVLEVTEEPLKYECRYGTKSINQSARSDLKNYIDLNDLDSSKVYQFEIVAINDKGESEPTTSMTRKPNGPPLPPVIWAEIPYVKKFYLGYSVGEKDESYEIQLGTSTGNYDQIIKEIKHKGSYSVSELESGKTYYYQLRRIVDGHASAWSEERHVAVL